MSVFGVKGYSRIDSIVLGQHAVYHNLKEKEGEVGRPREITCYRMRKATVTWLYTGKGPLHKNDL